MTYVVTTECESFKYTDCVEVCPVDAFHEGPDMLFINPDTCMEMIKKLIEKGLL